jgi:hypothetical protein
VRVPEAAAQGKAKVTVTFADWPEGNVTPATTEINIIDPVAAK